MKHNFSAIREVLQDAGDAETPEENERAMLTGRATPMRASVALNAIESRVAELEAEAARYREALEVIEKDTCRNEPFLNSIAFAALNPK